MHKKSMLCPCWSGSRSGSIGSHAVGESASGGERTLRDTQAVLRAQQGYLRANNGYIDYGYRYSHGAAISQRKALDRGLRVSRR